MMNHVFFICLCSFELKGNFVFHELITQKIFLKIWSLQPKFISISALFDYLITING